ncbi:MAG: hypothetical protein Q9219_007683 [cf. Caloplaca sp. 3 TL-2023]
MEVQQRWSNVSNIYDPQTVSGFNGNQFQRALAALAEDPERLHRARHRFSDSPPPYTSPRPHRFESATTRSTDTSASPTASRASRERKWQEEARIDWDRIASTPARQFGDQQGAEEKRIIEAERQRTIHVAVGTVYSTFAAENVKERWQEQGIWSDKWDIEDVSGMGERWLHEESLDPPPRRHNIFGGHEESVETDSPIPMAAIKRARSYSWETSYRRGIWDTRWGILPGMIWKHEQSLEELIQAANAPAVQAREATPPSEPRPEELRDFRSVSPPEAPSLSNGEAPGWNTEPLTNGNPSSHNQEVCHGPMVNGDVPISDGNVEQIGTYPDGRPMLIPTPLGSRHGLTMAAIERQQRAPENRGTFFAAPEPSTHPQPTEEARFFNETGLQESQQNRAEQSLKDSVNHIPSSHASKRLGSEAFPEFPAFPNLHAPEKRRRGRPKKHPEDHNLNDREAAKNGMKATHQSTHHSEPILHIDQFEDSKAAPKKRGRPRTKDSHTDQVENSKTAPKKRGRPRKKDPAKPASTRGQNLQMGVVPAKPPGIDGERRLITRKRRHEI